MVAGLVVPKFVWPHGKQGQSSLTLSFPATKRGGFDFRANRVDNTTPSNVRQSVYFGQHEELVLNLQLIRLSELSAWRTFVQFALSGGEFEFYEDSAKLAALVVTLEGENLRAAYQHANAFEATLRLRDTGRRIPSIASLGWSTVDPTVVIA